MNSPSRFHIASYLQPNPPNSKRVTRPSRWGNPYRVGKEAINAAEAVALFRDYIQQHPALVELAKRELAGFNLGCTCPLDKPCHADVWLEVVNSQLAYHPHTCRLIVQHLPKALLLALLMATPVGAKPLWENFRDMFLGIGRSDLMQYCAVGRIVNQNNLYYFDPRLQNKNKEMILSKGGSIEIADAMLAGQAAAMAVACPEVR